MFQIGSGNEIQGSFIKPSEQLHLCMFPPSEAASARTPKDRCVCAERAVSSGDGGADTPVPPPAAPQHPWDCPYHACAPHCPAHRTGARVRIAARVRTLFLVALLGPPLLWHLLSLCVLRSAA